MPDCMLLLGSDTGWSDVATEPKPGEISPKNYGDILIANHVCMNYDSPRHEEGKIVWQT